MKNAEKYLNNQLSKAEDDQITQVLLSNYYDRTLQKRWEQQLSEKYGLEAPQKTKTIERFSLKQLLAVAATFMLLLAAYQVNNNLHTPTSQELVAMQIADRYPHNNSKKGKSAESARSKGTDAYVLEDYKTAIQHYKPVITSENSTIDDHFFYGLCHLYSEQPKGAIIILKEALKKPITTTSTIRSKEIIHWYLGLAYHETGDIASATKELRTIKGPQKQAAAAILKVLE